MDCCFGWRVAAGFAGARLGRSNAAGLFRSCFSGRGRWCGGRLEERGRYDR